MTTLTTTTECGLCKHQVTEVCPDGMCRNCHKSLPWDDCIDGTTNANALLNRLGHSEEEVRKMYPNHRAVKKPISTREP